VTNRQQTDSYMVSLKTELTARSDPVPFGVAAYDAEDNEFDTLDGVQIGW
jgi:hypothetical protein